MAEYRSFAGFVQFDPEDAQAGTKAIRRVTFCPLGKGKDSYIKATIWDGYAHVPINRGDYMVADGKYEQRSVQGKIYHNLSVSKLLVIPAAEDRSATPVGAGTKKSDDIDF